MKVSRNWLQQYTDLKGLSTAEISHALTMVGFEVEGIQHLGLAPLAHVVVGEILSHTQHPNADKLSVCQVKVDEGEPRTIVCGAKNFKDGDRVIVALPGAVLPGDFKIKQSKLRGVESGGMMCSERELGIGEDHGGISILSERPEIGTSVNEVFRDGDTIFDVEVTPNRPDALSHLGMARELAAWFRRELKYPEIQVNLSAGPGGSLVQKISTESPEFCPHYRGYSIRGVKIGESPEWLKKQLRAIGLRPINNVVDATNYVLHETGQPLHAFDAARIRGSEIRVRAARNGEKMITLDGKERKLEPAMSVIADAERALVIAGVMGSLDAEVDATTQDIFLESAYFQPTAVRRTSRQLALSTDSSYRFERGVDPNGTEYAALRCIDLILQTAGGTLLGTPVVCGEFPLVQKEIELAPGFVRSRLGFHVENKEIVEILESLELEVNEATDASGEPLYRVKIPGYRQDLYRPIDLVEEFLRIYGCERIPTADVRATGHLQEDSGISSFIRSAGSALVGLGFNEAMHYSLRNENELRTWYGLTPAASLALLNPLASDASHLRPSLLPGLLDCLALNQARQNAPRRLFETGRVFRENDGRIEEMVSVALVILEDEVPQWSRREKVDFYTLSRIAVDLLRKAGVQVSPARFQDILDENPWQEGQAAQVGGLRMGFHAKMGLLAPAMTRDWNIRGLVFAATLYLSPKLLEKPAKRRIYQPFSSFPPAIRDLALLVDVNVSAGEVEERLAKLGQRHAVTGFALESVRIFDTYHGQGIPEGKKSLAFELVYRSPERTLQDKEVNQAFDNLQKAVLKDTDYTIRS